MRWDLTRTSRTWRHRKAGTTATKRITLAQFVESAGVTLTARRTVDNPNMDDADHMDNWLVTLKAGTGRMRLPYSMGTGHKGAAPTVASVLDCLASDAAGVANARDYDDWCAEYGYNTDSRRAERTYRIIQRQSAHLSALLGESAYQTLLWHTERE